MPSRGAAKPTGSERRILAQLDAAVRALAARGPQDAIADRLLAKLDAQPAAPMMWEPVPLDTYDALPPAIRSSWVFVLRRRTNTGAERHPNSHQRVMSLRASANLRTWEVGARGGRWRSNLLTSDPGAPLERRWLSIPVNVWHEPLTGEDHWTVVSFHTVAAHELIEERPIGRPDEPGSVQKYYL
jgi:hypothetical protein